MREIPKMFRFFRFHTLHMRSRHSIQKWQEKRLRFLIPYLATNIPLYRELLQRHAVNPSDIVRLRDLPRLPITGKQTFLGRFAEEYTDRSAPLRGRWVETSGTSGTPFAPLRRPQVNTPWYDDSLHYRFLMWENLWRVRANQVRVAHIRVLPRYRKNHLVVSVHDFLNDQKASMRRLADFQPEVLESHASILYELARALQSSGIPLRPKYVVSGGEQLLPAARQLIESVLQSEVYNRYGLEEFGTVGTECVAHDGFHVNVESYIVEIVDESGNLLPDGERGRILVTDLFNHQMPFVRYETGDYGHASWEPCACGLHAQRLWVEGRYSASITVGNKRYHHFEFGVVLDAFMNHLLHYQIAKRGENTIVVRIVPGPAFREGIIATIKEKILSLVGFAVVVRVESVSHISRVPRGKSRVVVDETVPAE